MVNSRSILNIRKNYTIIAPPPCHKNNIRLLSAFNSNNRNQSYLKVRSSGTNRQLKNSFLSTIMASHQLISCQDYLINLSRRIFLAGVGSVSPYSLIQNQISHLNNKLTIENENYSVDLDKFQNIYVVGFGKAVLPMAEGLLDLIGNHVKKCILSVPMSTRNSSNQKIEIWRGAKNNIPDSNSLSATQKIINLVQCISPSDFLIVLISGGGSALLTLNKFPASFDEKINLIKNLSLRGAAINELNVVRGKISDVKSGGLARMCSGKILSLILSDIVNDPVHLIASGPTFINSIKNLGSNYSSNLNDNLKLTPLSVLLKYFPNLEGVPSSICQIVEKNEEFLRNDEIESSSRDVKNIVIGSNKIALAACRKEAEKNGLDTIVCTSQLEGTAREIGVKIAKLADFLSASLAQLSPPHFSPILKNELNFIPDAKLMEIESVLQKLLKNSNFGGICLLLGGETVVKVIGNGKGGRNQEFALSASIELNKLKLSRKNGTNLPSDNLNCDKLHDNLGEILILSGGTDGIDGPTDAAGAFGASNVISAGKNMGMEGSDFLDRNDSYTYFQKIPKFHLTTGHTGTNVMDIIIVMATKPTFKISAKL